MIMKKAMSNMFTNKTGLISAIILTIVASPAIAAVKLTTGKDEQSFLPYWQIVDQGINLRLVQRLPDQVRGFFMSRKFSEDQAEIAANSCTFQTVFRNISNLSKPDTLKYNLRDWVIEYKGKKRRMKVREDWEKEWLAKKVKTPSRMDFEWAQVPTDWQYEPGDYNWGMTFMNLKPGSVFNLTVVWTQYGKTHRHTIKDIQCAPDIHPDPEEFRKQGTN
jgi:hypothetical protein